jgi:hypothetical protein
MMIREGKNNHMRQVNGIEADASFTDVCGARNVFGCLEEN